MPSGGRLLILAAVFGAPGNSSGPAFRGRHESPRKGTVNGSYNPAVARGWESKSVEAQQAEAEEKATPALPPLSAEEAARRRQTETLRLARLRVLQQLKASSNPRHRKLLEDALADLDQKLSRLRA